MTVLQVSETRQVFGRNYTVRFPSITPLSQTIGNAIDFRLFYNKKNQKKNIAWFWDQNQDRKYSVVLKQSFSKSESIHPSCIDRFQITFPCRSTTGQLANKIHVYWFRGFLKKYFFNTNTDNDLFYDFDEKIGQIQKILSSKNYKSQHSNCRKQEI